MQTVDTIRRTCIERLGAVDVHQFDYEVQRPPRMNETEADGRWFSLSIKLQADGEWLTLGRRRTRTELLTLANTLPVEHVGGRNFGRSLDAHLHWRRS